MNTFLLIAIVLLCYMSLWFVVSVITRRNDVADIAWGLGFVLVAWVSFAVSPKTLGGLVVSIMVTIWGLRLARHIAARHRRTTEDARYAQWRKTWRFFYLRSFLQVFVLQGILLYLVALPVLFITSMGVSALSLPFVFGLGIWLAGFLCESIADRQLRSFLAEPTNRGKIMDQGLWRYSRHPNYFGEVLLWWGIWVMTLAIPGSAVAILGPLTITVLILFVSGIPMLERRYANDPQYQAYAARTSVFIPWSPRKSID